MWRFFFLASLRLCGHYLILVSAILTYSHRIVLILALNEGEIVLLDVGTHDQTYRS